MLEFFRSYQRYFFVFIAVMVIASFVFFGAFSALIDSSPAREDRVVAPAVDGSSLRESEVKLLARFLATDQYDLPFKQGQEEIPNLCNDGALRHDLLSTGLANLIAASYFAQLRSGLDEKLEKIQHYRPYAHPEAASINALSVWERLVPDLPTHYATMMATTAATPATFHLLAELYLSQARTSPEFVRKVLAYQSHQLSRLNLDPRLAYADLALFGFHSLSDWFGSDFLEVAAQFILNGARLAEEKGFRVSREEAKGDLMRNFHQAVQRLPAAPPFTFRQHLARLGFDMKSAIAAWRSILLFRRYFESAGDAAFVDRLPFRDFGSFVQETAVVQLYRWPSYLKLRTLKELASLQLYIRAVSDLQDPLALPTDYLPLEEIRRRCPDLIAATYRATIASLQKEQVGLKAPLKEITEWALEETHWNSLRKQFSFLPATLTKEERFSLLERLDSAVRAQVDAAVRLFLVDEHPEWIEEAFAAAPKEEKTIVILPHWTSLPGILRGADVQAHLERGEPFSYSEEGKTLCRFEQIEKVEGDHLLSFDDAKKKGILTRLTEQFLETEYLRIRDRHIDLFQTQEGRWKPLSQVEEEVAYFALPPQVGSSLGKESESYSSYARHHLGPYSEKALAALQEDSEDPRFVQRGDPSIYDQFKLEKKTYEIQRTAQEEWMKEQAFVMVPKQWSSVHISSDGEIAFFYFDEKKNPLSPILEQISFGKETLAADAKRYLAENLLELMQKRGAIAPLAQAPEGGKE